MNKDIKKEFCENHSINILDTSKRIYRTQKIILDYFNYPDNFNIIDSYVKMPVESEPLYTVEIAESELERIAKFETRVFNNSTQKEHYRLFEALMEQKEKEKYLQEKYQAVKKAFEHYSLMLKLAESGEL